jgi:hypothetical protein
MEDSNSYRKHHCSNLWNKAFKCGALRKFSSDADIIGKLTSSLTSFFFPMV